TDSVNWFLVSTSVSTFASSSSVRPPSSGVPGLSPSSGLPGLSPPSSGLPGLLPPSSGLFGVSVLFSAGALEPPPLPPQAASTATIVSISRLLARDVIIFPPSQKRSIQNPFRRHRGGGFFPSL